MVPRSLIRTYLDCKSGDFIAKGQRKKYTIVNVITGIKKRPWVYSQKETLSII